ncbi:MAG: GxxExxY protein [bacterium]
MARKGPDNDDRTPLLEGELTGKIIAAFYETYNVLGFGFLESVYKKALAIELRLRGLSVQEEVPVDVFYKGLRVGLFRFDDLVEECVAVEIKASATLSPTDKAQTLNCLTSTSIDVGLLLHYGPEPKVYRFVSPRVHQ